MFLQNRLRKTYNFHSLEIQNKAPVLGGVFIFLLFTFLVYPISYFFFGEIRQYSLNNAITHFIVFCLAFYCFYRGRYNLSVNLLCIGVLLDILHFQHTPSGETYLSISQVTIRMIFPLLIATFFGTQKKQIIIFYSLGMTLIVAYYYFSLPHTTLNAVEFFVNLVSYTIFAAVSFFLSHTYKSIIKQLQKTKCDQARRSSVEIDDLSIRLSLASEISGAGVWEFDLENGKFLLDERLLKILGYKKNELDKTRTGLISIAHPDETDRLGSALDAHIRGDSDFFQEEYRVRAKNGDWKWFYTRAKLVENVTKNQPGKIVGITLDVTNKKTMGIALMESREKYKHLYESAMVGLYRISVSENKVQECNDRMVRLFGFTTKDQFIGTLATDYYLNNEDRLQMLDMLSSEGEVNNFETQFKRLDGSVFWASFSAGINHEKGYIEGVMTDITKLKEAEAAWSASEKRLQVLVENSLIGICIVQHGVVIYMNPEQKRIFGPIKGYTKFDVLNVHPDDIEKMKQLNQAILLYQPLKTDLEVRFYPFEDVSQKYDLKCVNIRTNLIEYQEDKAMLINMADITHTKNMEQLAQIKGKMTSLGHVAMGIAHEIRSPLSGINLLLDGIRENFEDREKVEEIKELLDQTQKAAAKIAAVVKRVLDFSRSSQPQSAMANINSPIRDAIKLLQTTIRKSNIQLESFLDNELPNLFIDLHLIEQVIINLINNAINALEETEEPRILHISSICHRYDIIVRVSDSGPGVPEHFRKKIFDPFFTTKRKSSGIGLSIIQRIIADHSGTINVSASELGGAEFIIRLPIERREFHRE